LPVWRRLSLRSAPAVVGALIALAVGTGDWADPRTDSRGLVCSRGERGHWLIDRDRIGAEVSTCRAVFFLFFRGACNIPFPSDHASTNKIHSGLSVISEHAARTISIGGTSRRSRPTVSLNWRNLRFRDVMGRATFRGRDRVPNFNDRSLARRRRQVFRQRTRCILDYALLPDSLPDIVQYAVTI